MIDDTIDKRLRNGQELSDKQLEEQVRGYRKEISSQESQELDLATVKKEKERERSQAYIGDQSGLERVVSEVKEFFGFGFKHELQQRHKGLSQRVTSYQSQINRFDALFEQASQKYSLARDERRKLEQYHQASTQLYKRSLSTRDTLEVDLEVLTESSSQANLLLHEKRDELFEVNKRLDSLYEETQHVSTKLQITYQQEQGSQAQLEKLRGQRAALLDQLSVANVRLNGLHHVVEMKGSGSTEGIIEGYENLGIYLQDTDRFLSKTSLGPESTIDQAFKAKYSSPIELHPDVEKWNKTPRP